MSPSLPHADAQRVLAAAEEHAGSIGQPMVIAVVDDAAHLVAFLRMDGAILGSIDVAQRKARTSALFRMPTSTLHPLVTGLEAPLHGIDTTNGGLIVFGGGVPLERDGAVVGAIGVSAGSAEQDTEAAGAGAAAL